MQIHFKKLCYIWNNINDEKKSFPVIKKLCFSIILNITHRLSHGIMKTEL